MDFLFPNVAYAESVDQFVANVDKLIINPLIILFFALAAVYFLWGVFEFLTNADNEEKKTDGKKHMIYGIIGIAIMISVFAIMNLILNTLNVEGVNPEEGTVQLNDYNPNWPK